MSRVIYIKKKDGTTEAFNNKKLRESLRRSGASPKLISDIIEHIDNEIQDGVTTDWIYRHAFQLLNRYADKKATYRYSLRRAVGELGPSGFPFERFVGEVFKGHGYKIEVGKMVKGSCVTHEVDVIADNGKDLVTAELKFHNQPFMTTDLKTALYVHARFEDIKKAGYYKDRNALPFLITNTKFSSSAIQFATCAGLNIMSWDFPKKGPWNLHDFIQSSKIHPVTALTAFSKKDQQALLEAGYITCRDIKRNKGRDLEESGLVSRDKIVKAFEEIDAICGITTE